MKRIVLGISMLMSFLCPKAQKPTLNLESYKSWPWADGAGISNDGRFIYWIVNNDPPGQHTVKIMKKNRAWTEAVANLGSVTFSPDSRYLLGTLPGDTLLVMDLDHDRIRKIPGVRDFLVLNEKSRHALMISHPGGNLSLADINGKIDVSFTRLMEYWLSPRKTSIVLRCHLKEEKDTQEEILLLDLRKGTSQQIFTGNNASGFIFDQKDRSLAFTVTNGDTVSLWHYTQGMGQASQVLAPVQGQLMISTDYFKFDATGERLFFNLRERPHKKEDNSNPDLEIWSSDDAYLKSFYYGGRFSNPQKSYLSYIDIDGDHHVRQLLHAGEQLACTFNAESDSIVVYKSSFGPENESWNPNSRLTYGTVSINTLTKKIIEVNRNIPLKSIQLSPTGKFVAYFDPLRKTYCSYELSNGAIRELTRQIPMERLSKFQLAGFPWPETMTNDIVAWIDQGQRIVVQGRFDLYSVDVRNQGPIIDLTNQVGEKERLVFCMLKLNDTLVKSQTGDWLLTAFDADTKDFGFYSLNPQRLKIKRLSMQPKYITDLANVYIQPAPTDLIKCISKDIFLIRWQSPQRGPNYFLSDDLVKFTDVSQLHPEQQVNWLSSELHSYTDQEGRPYQGVLYKPENFDSSKRYPVILNIYESKSNLLNAYPSPVTPRSEIAIAHLVSNGYIVFLPDVIKNTPGRVGDDVMASVISAVDHLAKIPWVDTSKIGICGGSTGGFEINYLVTHTDRFAAAISGAGISDLIAHSTTLRYGNSNLNTLNGFGYMMGHSFTENPAPYFKNSPLLSAKNMNTPLLFLHNTKDEAVDYRHTISFFTTLRSLGKKAWWLNYKTEGHSLIREQNRLDYHQRAFDFWNCYLKGMPPPQWMLKHLSLENR